MRKTPRETFAHLCEKPRRYAAWPASKLASGYKSIKRTLTNNQRRILSHPRGLIPSQVSAAPFANLEWTNDLPTRREAKAGTNKASLKIEKNFPEAIFQNVSQAVPDNCWR